MPCRAADQQSFRNTTVCGCYRSWSVWVHQTLVVALMEHNSHAFPGFLLKQRSLFALHLLKQQREWKLGTGDSLRRMGPVSRCHRKDVDGRCGMLQNVKSPMAESHIFAEPLAKTCPSLRSLHRQCQQVWEASFIHSKGSSGTSNQNLEKTWCVYSIYIYISIYLYSVYI